MSNRLKHDDSCELAKPDTPCHCECGGRYHAISKQKGLYGESMDKDMTIDMGGEVKEFIEKYEDKTIRCFGVCRKERKMDVFLGYEHDGGLADKEGRRWWVFFQCPKCRYGHSFAKMDFFIEHTEIEWKAEEERKNNGKIKTA